MIILFGTIIAAALVAGVYRYKHLGELDAFDRTIAAGIPVLLALLGSEIVSAFIAAPTLIWNEIRIARTYALFSGYKLYPGADTLGPIVGTLHTPVSHILFAPVVLVRNPATAIMVGSVIAFVLACAPVVWIHLSGGAEERKYSLVASFALIAWGFAALQSDGIRSCAFNVHVDAAAVCAGVLAGAILFRSEGNPTWGSLVLSASFAVLSLWSKQTMAPLVIALCLFVILADGWDAARRYVVCLLGSGLGISALFAGLFWPPKNLLFNIVTLAGHRPSSSPVLLRIREAFYEAKLELVPVAFPLLLFTLYWFFYERDAKETWRAPFSRNRWIVFVLMGACLMPVSIKARMTVGGDVNHLGAFSYFLLTGTTLCMKQMMTKAGGDRVSPIAAKLAAAVLIIVSLPAIPAAIARAVYAEGVRKYSVSVAYEYSTRHPQRAYFPFNPLAEILAERKLYHFDSALSDRELVGHPITDLQLLSGMPADAAIIAIPPGMIASGALTHYVAGWPRAIDPELPGWTVLTRPATETSGDSNASTQ